ncbi:MAG: hypothetical protein WBV72_07170, partial [Nitrososphaeraceae archaeon]
LWGCEFMFYDSYDHFALALNAKSKIVRIDSGNKNYLLPYGTVGFPRIQVTFQIADFIHSHL